LGEEKKLVIRAQKHVEPTTIISMRIPKDMLADLDMVASESGRTRNEILMLSLEFALSHMEIDKN
jgi:predicted DNA-binding protein